MVARAAVTMRAVAIPGLPARPSTPPVVLTGMQTIAGQFKGVLMDQYGVLHDGKTPHSAAIETISRMAADEQRILILSNSSRRSSGAIAKLAKMGFEESDFVGAITSGEVTHQMLSSRPSRWWQTIGNRCVHLTWGERGAIPVGDLNLQITTDPPLAGFILAHGTEALGQGDGREVLPQSLAELEGVLEQCAASCTGRHENEKVPMIVANPDLVTVSGSELVVMPGTLGKKYEAMGGKVHLMGKPADVIYKQALTLLDIPRGDVVAVGDSMEHDIRGAFQAGIASVFVCGGIHAAETLSDDGSINMDGLMELCEKYNAWPDYVLPALQY